MGKRYGNVWTKHISRLADEMNRAASALERDGAYIIQTHLISGTHAIIEYFVTEKE